MGKERDPSQPSQFKPTARQQEAQKFLEGSQRHTLLVGGARSGKTTLLVHEIVTRALRVGASRHAILRFRANAVRPSIALDTLPKVFRLGFPGHPLTHHRTDGYFSLQNGSEIWIGGLDDQEAALLVPPLIEKLKDKMPVRILNTDDSAVRARQDGN